MPRPFQPQRILLTGATGTVGRLIFPALTRFDAPIRVLAHVADPLRGAHPLAELRHGDLERPESLRGIADECDVVVHAAARPGFSVLDRERQRRVNAGGTEAVLKEAQSSGASRFIFLGYTGTVQERGDTTTPVDEETPPEPSFVSESVRMKYEAESLVLEANQAARLRTLVLSPGVLAAPGSATALGGLIEAFVKRELPYRLLDDVWIAVSSGEDVGDCVAAAIERGQGGRRYFATGECLRLGTLYDRLARVTGVPAPRRRLPDLLVEELGLLTPVLPPHSFLRQLILPRELVLHLTRLAPVTNTRTRSELGFVPTQLDDLLTRFARSGGILPGDAVGVAG